MLTEHLVNELNIQLQRIFCLPITRSTFRDLQNVIFGLAGQSQDKANLYFEILLTGSMKDGSVSEGAKEKMRTIIERYTVPVRMSKEVFERGEFIGGMTSDIIFDGQNGQNPFIVTRIRRIDGQELQVINNAQTTLFTIQHHMQRLEELSAHEKGKEQFKHLKEQLNQLKTSLNSISEALV